MRGDKNSGNRELIKKPSAHRGKGEKTHSGGKMKAESQGRSRKDKTNREQSEVEMR